MRRGAVIVATLTACTRPPIVAELPPATGPGDRVAVVTSELGTTAFYLDERATRPTFSVDDDGRLRVRVVELGETRAALNLSAESPTETPSGPSRSLVGFRAAQERSIETAVDSPWVPLGELDPEAARVRLPVSSPCFALSLAQQFEVNSTNEMRLLPQTDDELLVASGRDWYRAGGDQRVESIASPVDGLTVLDLVPVPGGGAWVVGRREDPSQVELWRQEAVQGPFSRVYTSTLAALTADPPLRLAAASTRAAYWLSAGGHITRVEPGAPPLEHVPSVRRGGSIGSIVAVSDDEAVALVPFDLFDPGDRYVVEVSTRGARLDAVTTTVGAAVAYSVGKDAEGTVWVGGNDSDVVPLSRVKRAPREVALAAARVRSVGPAFYGPWRGLVFFGTGGLLTYRWAGFTETLDLRGKGDCRVGGSGLSVQAVALQARGLWLVGRGEDETRWRLMWSAVMGGRRE